MRTTYLRTDGWLTVLVDTLDCERTSVAVVVCSTGGVSEDANRLLRSVPAKRVTRAKKGDCNKYA